MGDSAVGLHARLMSQALRKLTATIAKTNTTCIFINQLREKIGVMFGNPETTTGGNALKFYASVRLDIRKSTAIKDGDNILGNTVKVKVVKNKVAPPSVVPSSRFSSAKASRRVASLSIWAWSTASSRRAVPGSAMKTRSWHKGATPRKHCWQITLSFARNWKRKSNWPSRTSSKTVTNTSSWSCKTSCLAYVTIKRGTRARVPLFVILILFRSVTEPSYR